MAQVNNSLKIQQTSSLIDSTLASHLPSQISPSHPLSNPSPSVGKESKFCKIVRLVIGASYETKTYSWCPHQGNETTSPNSTPLTLP